MMTKLLDGPLPPIVFHFSVTDHTLFAGTNNKPAPMTHRTIAAITSCFISQNSYTFDAAKLLIVVKSAKFLGYSAWFCDKRTELSILTAENPFAQTLYGGLVIVYLHRFEGALQFVHQFWIETTHTIGELHAERLDAGELLDADHVLETEVKEVRPQVVLAHL